MKGLKILLNILVFLLLLILQFGLIFVITFFIILAVSPGLGMFVLVNGFLLCLYTSYRFTKKINISSYLK